MDVTAACEQPRTTIVTTAGGRSAVDQDPITVCKQNVWLTWKIDPTQEGRYEFHEDSIVIVSDPEGSFDNCKVGKGGNLNGTKKEISCLDKNPTHGKGTYDYKYNVRVYWIGGGEAGYYDPNIVNN
jgi:hypothetical protein